MNSLKSEMTLTEWRDGDVFQWAYKDSLGDYTQKYWCKSRIGVVRAGRMHDTYWLHLADDGRWHGSSDGHRWEPSEAAERLELDFRGNLSDFDRIDDYRVRFYAPADILDMRHANDTRGPIFLRKDARRDSATILAEIARRTEKEESAICSAHWGLERLAEMRAKVEAGDLDGISF